MPRDWKILGMTSLAACGYGVLHDQVTIRICPEYFTVAHPPLFRTHSLPALALCWGIAATAPFGLAFGLILARVSRVGDCPVTPMAQLGAAIVRLLAVMALAAILAGFCGYCLTPPGWTLVLRRFDETLFNVDPQRFAAVWLAHAASYAVGTIGGATLCWRTWRRRGSPPALTFFPCTPGALIRTLFIIAVAALLIWLRFARS